MFFLRKKVNTMGASSSRDAKAGKSKEKAKSKSKDKTGKPGGTNPGKKVVIGIIIGVVILTVAAILFFSTNKKDGGGGGQPTQGPTQAPTTRPTSRPTSSPAPPDTKCQVSAVNAPVTVPFCLPEITGTPVSPALTAETLAIIQNLFPGQTLFQATTADPIQVGDPAQVRFSSTTFDVNTISEKNSALYDEFLPTKLPGLFYTSQITAIESGPSQITVILGIFQLESQVQSIQRVELGGGTDSSFIYPASLVPSNLCVPQDSC